MASESPTRPTGTAERTARAATREIGLRTLALGTVSGVGAALLGYLLTYALLASSAMSVLARHGPQYSIARDVLPQFSGSIPVWQAVGWLYYNAHWASVKFQQVGQQGGNFLNFLAYEGGALAWLWLLPAIILVGTGALFAYLTDLRTWNAGALAGATITVGYALALLVGIEGLAVEVSGVLISPELTLVALLGFPLVFGCLGGLLGSIGNRS